MIWKKLKIGDFVNWNNQKWEVMKVDLKNELVILQPTEEYYPKEMLLTYTKVVSNVYPQDKSKQLSSIKLWRD